jgi:hypothetical protein
MNPITSTLKSIRLIVGAAFIACMFSESIKIPSNDHIMVKQSLIERGTYDDKWI